ncbi:flagellar protein FlaG [Paenibacillus sp. FSL R7-0331]|uniref:flagellar protein FlaG n=1 Tax=Paenibacillus sp. FSL R7-0331 TaxID=1536773 RepID=UPI0004F690F8|nr:flagellar protein FlaG [Paenibacillus sp. FSL R7-0331]AIQ55150.1 hypothetical protein R70331_29130 [Paenibacillus sp. FSL R7-0331]
MNVQISLSTNIPMGEPFKPEAATMQTLSSEATQIRDTKELVAKERQGVSVSAGEEHLIRTIEKAFKSLQGPETMLDISIHEKTHKLMVKVMNKETGELIREVPPEKTLDLVAKMMELAGIMIDERV